MMMSMQHHQIASSTAVIAVAALVGLSLALISCAKDYDLERPDHERGTLGEELHRMWVKDSARSATNAEERTALLHEREEEFVSSVDRTVPPGHVRELDEFLIALLPVIEEGYLPAVSRRIPGHLEEAMADEDLMQSLEEPPLYRAREFTTPLERRRMVDETIDYDRLPELIAHLGQTFVDNDGFDASGQQDLEVPSSYSDLLRAIAHSLEKEPKEETGQRWATTLRDLFVVADNRYRSGEPPRNTYIAIFDDRGLPKVRRDDGELRAPFVDQNGNGLADVDDEGRFILDNGQVLAIPPLSRDDIAHPDLHRDVFGRVETTPNHFMFEYVDISETALPYLVRMIGDLAEEQTLYHVSSIGREVLGPPEVAEDGRGLYRAFPQTHAIVDLQDALVSGLAITELPEVMSITARYIDRHVDDLAFFSYAVGNMGDVVADHPEIDVHPDQTLVFDILDLLREIAAEPELWADVMEALRDPIMERGGEAMATLVQYRDTTSVPQEDGPYDACFHGCKDSYTIGTEARFDCIRDCPMEEIFSDPTDFDAPESLENRSRHQRLFHLLRDTAGTPYELSIEELDVPDFNIDPSGLPPLASLPGAAEAFVRSVAGELHLSEYIADETENEIGILINLLSAATGGSFDTDSVAELLSIASELFGARLDVEPTPDQITRLFNQEELRYEEGDTVIEANTPVCKDGFEMAKHHADGLYASEASGLIDVLHPLAYAFAKHEREELLTSIFLIVHDHYAGRDDLYLDAEGNPSPMKASNLVSAEEAMLEIFDDGEIFAALRALALSMETLTDTGGIAIEERLRQLLYKWLRNDEGYSPRSEPYIIELPDGRQLDSVSRVEVILDRLNEMIERAELDEEVRQHLKSAATGFFDVALSAEEVDEADYRFEEEGVVAFTTHLLRYVGARADELDQSGELEPWLTEELPEGFMKFYGSRAFYAFIMLLDELHDEGDGQAALEELPKYLADSDERADRVAISLYAVIVQLLDLQALMPTGRFVMEVLDPDREQDIEPHAGLPNGSLIAYFLALVSEADEEGYGLDILARGLERGESYGPAWSTLIDVVLRYFSPEPTATENMPREHREQALDAIGGWLHDGYGGLERYYELVELRGELELEELE